MHFPGLEARSNTPFGGAYVPLKHYQTDARVRSARIRMLPDSRRAQDALTQKS
ncbi:hypothetical protein [Cryobacterium sp. GrIS_2_6]|uniref:hypothetical protein n=1 Tax=Cryobacterium sp. GrIS_2_6 TaxID=3162785 RepID=UPI002DFA9EEB|nr:hypothetical protein [Cryobacterium psychrotolerans]